EEYNAQATTNHYKITGKERDAESGLDYFGARYHSGNLGRFMSPDWAATPVPVPYADLGDPQSLNLYSYVRNSPVTRSDPDGHDDQNNNKGAAALTDGKKPKKPKRPLINCSPGATPDKRCSPKHRQGKSRQDG